MIGHREELLVGVRPAVGEHVHVDALAGPAVDAVGGVRVHRRLQLVAVVTVEDHVEAKVANGISVGDLIEAALDVGDHRRADLLGNVAGAGDGRSTVFLRLLAQQLNVAHQHPIAPVVGEVGVDVLLHVGEDHLLDPVGLRDGPDHVEEHCLWVADADGSAALGLWFWTTGG